jgi:hypothetical protein
MYYLPEIQGRCIKGAVWQYEELLTLDLDLSRERDLAISYAWRAASSRSSSSPN